MVRMRRPAGGLLAVCAALGVLALAARPAAAERSIVLLEIEGARDGKLRKSIGRLIAKQHRILSVATYEEMAQRLHAEKLNTSDVRKVCGRLQCDGILDGTVMAIDDGYRLVLRLREGKSGRIAWRQRIKLKDQTISKKLQPELRKRLLREIDGLEPVSEDSRARSEDRDEDRADEDEEDRDEDRAEKSRSRKRRDRDEDEAEDEQPRERANRGKARKDRDEDEADDAEPRERASRGKARKDRDEGEADGEDDDEGASPNAKRRTRDRKDEAREEGEDTDERDAGDGEENLASAADEDGDEATDEGEDEEDDGEDEDDDADEDPLLTKQGDDEDGSVVAPLDPREHPVVFHVGGGALARRLHFRHSSLPMDLEPDNYHGAAVASMAITGEVYPLAFVPTMHRALRSIGIGFAFDRPFRLNTQVDDGTGMVEKVPTKQQRFGVNLRYRLLFGEGVTAPSVYFSVGYNRSKFEIDRNGAGAMLTVPDTEYTYFDPGVGARFGLNEHAAILVEARAVLVRDAGQIQEPEQYGAASITGFDTELGFEYWITRNFLVRLGGRLMMLGYDFEPNTGLLLDPDADGTSDVGGARDTWYGGTLSVGYAL